MRRRDIKNLMRLIQLRKSGKTPVEIASILKMHNSRVHIILRMAGLPSYDLRHCDICNVAFQHTRQFWRDEYLPELSGSWPVRFYFCSQACLDLWLTPHF